MKTIFETQRFIVREHGIGDAPDLFRLNSDPDVTRYTGDQAFASVEEAARLIQERMASQYARFHMGRWAVREKTDGAYVGWCGLKYLEDEHEVDLGYRFSRAHWGRGIATETARASIEYGFDVLRLDRMIADAMTANTASIRVLEKVGMQRLSEVLMDGHSAIRFEIRR